MKYGIIFRLEFQARPEAEQNTGDIIRVDMSPTNVLIPDADDPEIITLVGGANPLIISTANNSEDKMQPIRSKQADISIQSGNGISINTFSTGAGIQWACDIYHDPDNTNKTIFKGFLVTSELEQLFLPDSVEIRLTASDNLGKLKDQEWKNLAGENPQGYITMGEAIAFALRQTGLSLPINVINNLRHGSGEADLTASFTVSGNTLTFASTANFFYPGQEITISNTASNNGTFKVRTVTSTTVTLDSGVVNEASNLATFLDTSSLLHIYQHYIDARTFEKDSAEAINSYDVIARILGEYCYIFQYLGEWWIVNIDEYDTNLLYIAVYDADGVFQSIGSGVEMEKEIGPDEDHKFINARAMLRLQANHKLIKETWNIDAPKEIICNQFFDRGDLDTEPDPETKIFDLDGWTRVIVDNGTGAESPTTGFDAFIEKKYGSQDNIIDKYAVLEFGGYVIGSRSYIKSCPIPLMAKDKFTFGGNWRLRETLTGSNERDHVVATFVFEGKDGNTYVYTYGTDPLNPLDYKWVTPVSDAINFLSIQQPFVPDIVDTATPQSFSKEVSSLPVDGYLYIYLATFNQDALLSEYDILYSGLTFDYLPYIAGAYDTFRAHYHQVADADNVDPDAKREEQVYLRDSLWPLIKGGMFFEADGEYELTRKWYAANTTALDYPISQDFMHPYGYTQAYAVWNQFNNIVSKFTPDVLRLGTDWPDLIHKYLLTETDPNTSNRQFIVISMSQDWRNGVMTCTLAEVYRTDLGKDYSATHTEKFVTNAG